MGGVGVTGRRVRSFGFGLVLILLALAVRLAVPAGFMPGAGGALVVCTGHGPMTMSMGPKRSDSMAIGAGQGRIAPGKRAPPPRTEQACAFAGNGMGPAPTTWLVSASSPVAFPAAPGRTLSDQAPGQGLAAPPPPSRGPPLLS